MENYIQEVDLTLLGVQVETFPLGIKEAFDSLVRVFGFSRPYYGVSWIAEDGRIEYYAITAEGFKDEAKEYNYTKLSMPKGEYLAKTVFDWMSKTDRIKEVFDELTAGTCPRATNPCIEYYKSDDEMVCMVKKVQDQTQ
jgi:hypothetical protein